MKLAFLEIAGFRGFKDKTRFDFPFGFVVLTGRNGVGKSTVLDAIDFAVTGSINKYDVRVAKGGGLEDHIWWVGSGEPEDQFVRIGFIDNSGEEFVITRSRERGLDINNDEIAKRLCLVQSQEQGLLDTLMKTTLIRDETIARLSLDLPEQARFAAVRDAMGGLAGPDHAKRAAAILNAADKAKGDQAKRVEGAQAELGRTLTALTEARSTAERQPDVAEAEQNIKVLEPQLAAVTVERAEKLRHKLVERKHAVRILEEAISRAEGLYTEGAYFTSEAGKAEIAAARSGLDVTRRAYENSQREVVEAKRLEAIERESDGFASHMVSLLEHGAAIGLQIDHCPLCNAIRTSNDFESAIAAARARLSERGVRVAATIERVQKAQLALAQTEKTLAAAETRLTQMESRQKVLNQGFDEIRQLFRQYNLSASANDPVVARRQLLQKQEEIARLERALLIFEASAAHDRMTALQVRVEQLRVQVEEESAKLTTAERAFEAARQIENSTREVANQMLTEQFDTVMPLLKELYRRLRPHADWKEIEIDFGGRVRASLNFSVGDGRNPQFVFSSGQRRAAGVAFLLAIHLSRPWCRLQSLLLDDPVQHIDDYRALNLVEVLAAIRRTGRQIIVAVEDVALADVLCRRLRSTAVEFGRRFELSTAKNGSASIASQRDIFPLPRGALRIAEVS